MHVSHLDPQHVNVALLPVGAGGEDQVSASLAHVKQAVVAAHNAKGGTGTAASTSPRQHQFLGQGQHHQGRLHILYHLDCVDLLLEEAAAVGAIIVVGGSNSWRRLRGSQATDVGLL